MTEPDERRIKRRRQAIVAHDKIEDAMLHGDYETAHAATERLLDDLEALKDNG